MLLLNRKKWEEGKGGFQGKFQKAAPDRAGPARQGSFVQRWELSVFLSTQGTAPSLSSQAPCGAQFFVCNIQPLSSCQMIHCRPAELICAETSQFWIVSHRLPQRGSHSKWAAGITKTKPRHLPAPPRRCLGFPPWHV